MMNWKMFLPAVLVFSCFMSGHAAETPEDGAMLGVFLSDRTDSIKGAEVTGVVKGAGAEKSGIKKGDVIIGFNGEKVASAEELRKKIAKVKPGDEVKVTVMSEGRKMVMAVKMSRAKSQVADLSQPFDTPQNNFKDFKGYFDYYNTPKNIYKDAYKDYTKYFYMYDDHKVKLGVSLIDLTQQLEDYFEVEHGVLISSVVKGGAAEKMGLKAGDVIIKLGDRPIKKSNDIHTFLRNAKKDVEVTVRVKRKGKTMETTAKLKVKKDSQSGVTGMFWGPKGAYEFKDNAVYGWYGKFGEAGKVSELEELKKGLKDLQKQIESLRKEIKEK